MLTNENTFSQLLLNCFRYLVDKQYKKHEPNLNTLVIDNNLMPTPSDTPISRLSSDFDKTSSSSSQRPHTVEIHELFEPNDLNETWQETFVTRNCYVWVPKSLPKKVHKTSAT